MKYVSVFLVFTLALLYQNCGKPTELAFESSTDLSSQAGLQNASVQILNKNCFECHNTTTMDGNVSDITNIEYLVYSRLIVPGEPELSPIIAEIASGRMPKGRAGLTGLEVETIKSWIAGLDADDLGPGGPLVPIVIEPKYSSLAQQIFTPRCITCHSNRNYRLNSHAQVLRTVTPGNAANSLLYQAVTVGRDGGKMPQGGGLSSAQIKAIEDWINSGAPNN